METHCDDELGGTKITLSGLVEVLFSCRYRFMNKLVVDVWHFLAFVQELVMCVSTVSMGGGDVHN